MAVNTVSLDAGGCMDTQGAIDPTKIPGADIDPEAISAQATVIDGIGETVRDEGASVLTAWQGMSGVYTAPESATLLSLMSPVGTSSTTTGDNLQTVASALEIFAEEVAPIKKSLDGLRQEAWDFLQGPVWNGVDVQETNPAWTSVAMYGGVVPADIPMYHTVHKAWNEDQATVDANNDLIRRVNDQMVLLWQAERTAANKIRALYGGGDLHAYQSEDDALGYGLDEIPEGAEMPWGAPVERKEGCGEATANFVFRDFLWEGIVVGGIWGTVEGLGTLVLGYNPETGDFFSGEAYGQAWSSVGMLAAGAIIYSTPGLSGMFAVDSAMDEHGDGGFLPDWARDFKGSVDETLVNTGKGLIAWDKWADDPGTALGESVFNVGTILIPAGATVTGIKTASTAANVMSKMAKFSDLVDPGTWALKGALKVGGLGLDGLKGLKGLTGLTDDLSVPHFDVDLPETGSGLNLVRQGDAGETSIVRADTPEQAITYLVDELGVPVENIYAVNRNGASMLETPGLRIELREGFDMHAGGTSASAPEVSGVKAVVPERELVGVGGREPNHVTNSLVDDAPPAGTRVIDSEAGAVRETTTAHETGSGNGTGHGSDGAGSRHGGDGGHGTGRGHGGGDDAGRGHGGGDDAGRGHGGDVEGDGHGGDATGRPAESGTADAGSKPEADAEPDAAAPGDVREPHGAGDPTTPPVVRSADDLVNEYLASRGIDPLEVHALRVRDIANLSTDQLQLLQDIREAVPMVDASTPMVKVIPFSDIDKYIDGPYTRVDPAGDRVAEVGGFVLREVDIDTSVPLAQIVKDLRLDYTPSRGGINEFVQPGSDSYGFLRFTPSDPGVLEVPFSPEIKPGSAHVHDAPFTGNGMLKNPDTVFRPEYYATKRMRLRDGTELWVNENGVERLVAVFDNERGFVRVP